jgi:dTDP-4-amino-4,6-dideoxygalactose transaminase
VKLKHIKEWSDRRIEIAKLYSEGLKDCALIDLPYVRPDYRHVFHLYVIETKNPADRSKLLDDLVQNGVDAKTHYSIAIHQQEGFPWGKAARIVGPLTHAEKNAAACISLPMFPELEQAEIDYVINVVRTWGEQ